MFLTPSTGNNHINIRMVAHHLFKPGKMSENPLCPIKRVKYAVKIQKKNHEIVY